MPSSTQIRLSGWIMLLAGLFLVGLMGTITYYLAPELLHPGAPSASGSRWTGTAQQAQLLLALFAVVIVFGLTSIINGLWAIVTGARNKWMMIVTVGVFLILALTGFLLSQSLKS